MYNGGAFWSLLWSALDPFLSGVLDSDAFVVDASEIGRMTLPLLGFAESSIQLVPDGTLFFHLALIIAMVALLNATLLKPINRILEERERLTKGRLSEAQRTLLTVNEKLAEYERRLREARAEGYALMERERAVISEERLRKLAEVKSEMARLLAAEKEKLKVEGAQVRGKLAVDARAIALEIGRQILRRPIAG
jgi:F-type H+-transporting ATPase subunit b